MSNDQIRARLAAQNIYVARGLAREDDTIDVDEDDHRPADEDTQLDDIAAGDHDA